ncbi:MAG: dienelactone hydrolase family protein [Edaphobacter sp.]
MIVLTYCFGLSIPRTAFAFHPRLQYFKSSGKSIAYETLDAGPNTPIIILLSGTSGPETPFIRSQARIFQASHFTVMTLHYFDAGSTHDASQENYRLWVRAVEDLVSECNTDAPHAHRKIGLLGYSLGAEIALAVGSQLVPVAAIAEWYGGLPDVYFRNLKGMPPLLILHGTRDSNIPVVNATQLVKLCALAGFNCRSHIYPDQEHGFIGKSLEDADSRTVQFFLELLK